MTGTVWTWGYGAYGALGHDGQWDRKQERKQKNTGWWNDSRETGEGRGRCNGVEVANEMHLLKACDKFSLT